MSASFFEFAPLLLFFAVNLGWGIFWATGVLLVSSVALLGLTYLRTKKVSKILVFSTCLVVILGAATLLTQNETFIKMKPTAISGIFAVVVLLATWMGKNPIKYFLRDTITLSKQGWRALAYCWTLAFALSAILNEIVWRSFDTDTWVSFKVFGLTLLNLVFAIISAFILVKYKENKNRE